VQADFGVELGPDDETLDLPWADEASGLRYYDLKRHPDLLFNIEEAQREPALREFLAAMNSTSSNFETAKCDAWPSTEIYPEEEIFGATHKFGSYVDLLFTRDDERLNFSKYEELAKQLTVLLKKVPEIPASAEFLIRRCYYRGTKETGFFITLYLFGYGADEGQAHQQWVIGMKLVENAIRQAGG
jgi:hypothetical protein